MNGLAVIAALVLAQAPTPSDTPPAAPPERAAPEPAAAPAPTPAEPRSAEPRSAEPRSAEPRSVEQAPAAAPAPRVRSEPASAPSGSPRVRPEGAESAAPSPAVVTTTVRRRRLEAPPAGWSPATAGSTARGTSPSPSPTSTTTSTTTKAPATATGAATPAPVAAPAPPRPVSGREEAEQAARIFLDALARRDANALAGLAADRFSFDGDVLTGRESIRRAWRDLLVARPEGPLPAVGAVELLEAEDAAARFGKPPARLAPLVRRGVTVAVADLGGRTVVLFVAREAGRMAVLGMHD